MSIASNIMHTARNADDAIDRAEAMDPNVNQDWDHEATFFTFEDGSVLAVSGPQVNAYEDAGACVADFPGTEGMLA